MSNQEKLLIIVESPSKTKTIAKYIDNASVIASVGHFKDLPKKEMGIDIENDFAMKIQIMPDRKKFITQLQSELKKASPLTVYAESTPNPNVMKFVVNKKLFDDVYEFKKVEHTNDAPLAKSLFNFPFVKEVFFDFNFISIIQKANSNWDENVMDVREFIRSFIQDDNTIIYKENFIKKSEPNTIEDLDDVSKNIIEIIEKHVKPAVASDGGNIVFKSYDNESKKVNVILQGACSGCPSSTITLKSGIENMLKEMLPGMISSVNAING